MRLGTYKVAKATVEDTQRAHTATSSVSLPEVALPTVTLPAMVS